jgi:hypothetical protein
MNEEYTETDGVCNKHEPDFVSKRRLPAPQKIRHGETRGGGFIVVMRTRKKRLLRPSAWPVEVASLADAVIAAKRLREKFPDQEFCIFEQIGSFGGGE